MVRGQLPYSEGNHLLRRWGLINHVLEEVPEGDRFAKLLQLEALNRSRDESAELASRVFELSQTLSQKWVTAEYAEKRQILEIVWLNCRLDDLTLVPTIRKPFDVLAEGLLVPDSGGSRTPVELFSAGVEAWGHAEISVFAGVFAANLSS